MAGVLPTDVTLKRDGDTLILAINGTLDSLSVSNYFYLDATNANIVNQIKFADGTILDVAAVKNKMLTGTSDYDTLIGYSTADAISGLSGE